MMRLFFTTLCLCLAGVLAGCGFTPMHSVAGSTAPLANIQVDMLKGADVVDNQAGFFVTQRLRDRMGVQPDSAPYRLEISPRYRRTRLGLTNADVASRYDITVSARWVLYNTKTGKKLEQGTSSSVTTFGAPDGPYGVITADNVGVEQSSKETADKLIVDLARYFATKENIEAGKKARKAERLRKAKEAKKAKEAEDAKNTTK